MSEELRSGSTSGPGQIITFYSYKGGTGRTMAVANIAWILASCGNQVLVVDWDLESPGLHRYFHPFLLDKKLRDSRGVIDLIRDFAAAAVQPHPGPEDPNWYERYADVESVAASLTWTFPGDGVIDFLPAGLQDRSYSKAVSTFDWPAFYDRLNGGVFLRALRQDMRKHYDYVLIDSRTGLSDTASICTVLMPDIVVNCFTLSQQSIEGAASVSDSINNQRVDNPVRMLPVPMRVEDAEQVKLEAGRDYARHRFAPFLRLPAEEVDRYWGDVEIPYKPYYAYEEILATFGDRARQENSLLASFERLTRVITHGAVQEMVPLDERERRQWLAEFERPKQAATSDVLVSYASVDRMWAEWVKAELGQVGLRVILQEVDFSTEDTDPADLDQTLGTVNRTLILLSQHYMRSANASRFWPLVVNRDPGHANRFLVPVRLDSSRAGPPFNDRYPAVDLANLTEEQARLALLTSLDQPAPAPSGDRPDDGSRTGPRYPAIPPPVWNAPQRNVAFTGRSDVLEELRDRLSASVTVVVPLALYGLGGVGKTQLAIEYAHRFAPDYDVVWWVPAEQPSLVRSSLAALAQKLQVAGETVAESVQAVLDALRRGEPYRRWLIVFDNADDPDELRDYRPEGTGHVLLTSRNHAWRQVAEPLQVGVFKRPESITFLQKRAPSLTDDEAGQVAEKLGDLPLAIEQAGAWLAVTGMPVAQYLELLDTQLLRVLGENAPPGYERTAAATWLLSLERLREHKPAAAKLLEVCAFFGPEPIPMSLLYSERFVEVLLPYDPSLNDPFLQGTLVQEIGRYALASIDSAQASIQLHRLVQAVIRDRLSPREREEDRAHVHQILAAANPKDADEPDNWKAYERLWPHIVRSEALESTAPTVRQLITDMARYLWKFGDHTSSQDLAEQAVTTWRRVIGGERDDLVTLLMRWSLANSLRSQAKYQEAYQTDQEVYDELTARYGRDHPYAIMTLISRAADLRTLGQYADARDLDTEALARSKAVLGEDNSRTLTAASNLAVSLRLTGDFRAATQLDEETWAQRRRVLGERHPMTLLSTKNYGQDLRDMGDFQGARQLLEASLETHKEVLGDRHPETLRTAKTLAVTLRKLGDFDTARALTQTTLSAFTQVLGPAHPDTINCTMNLASDHSAIDDDESARRIAQGALDRYRAALGDDHPLTLACRNNLAIFMRDLGDRAAARVLAEQVANQLRTSLGDDHPYTLASMINHANDLYDAEERAAARRVDENTYHRLTRILGEDHPDALAAGNNLSISQRATGDLVDGQRLMQQVLDRSIRVLGEEHPNTVAIRTGTRLNCDLEPPPA
jgi:cellulose biosynthesis protein BcsQ